MRSSALDRCLVEAFPRTMHTLDRTGPNSHDTGTVLVVEDEPSNDRSLRFVLSSFRLVIFHPTRSEEAVDMLRTAQFDAAILNMTRSGMRSREVCRGMRKHSPRLPILILAATNDEDHVLEAFEAGADDYIPKPFRHCELIARLKAAIRRGRRCNGYGTVITVGDLSLDVSRHLARKNGHPLHLTPTQFKLLHFLMANLGKALSHAKLLMNVWGPGYGGELEYLRTFVRQLRKKIEDDPAKPRYLLTESHFGYRFSELV